MLDGLFPDDVLLAWGDPGAASEPLFPEEEALVAFAVDKRRREFAKGRECARSALAGLGFRDVILLAGESREPLWPADVVGSITHTQGLCVAAVARAARYRGIGIDAEPAEALSPEVAARVCAADETGVHGLPAFDTALAARLVFSAKETVYKCLFPITRRFLGFGDVRVELGEATFRARLGVDAAPFARGTMVEGRWRRLDAPSARGRAPTHFVTTGWIRRESALP